MAEHKGSAGVHDYEFIGKRFQYLRARDARLCHMRNGLPTGSCWCIGAAKNGMNLDCPPVAEPLEAKPYVERTEPLFKPMEIPWHRGQK